MARPPVRVKALHVARSGGGRGEGRGVELAGLPPQAMPLDRCKQRCLLVLHLGRALIHPSTRTPGEPHTLFLLPHSVMRTRTRRAPPHRPVPPPPSTRLLFLCLSSRRISVRRRNGRPLWCPRRRPCRRSVRARVRLWVSCPSGACCRWVGLGWAPPRGRGRRGGGRAGQGISDRAQVPARLRPLGQRTVVSTRLCVGATRPHLSNMGSSKAR